MLSRVCSPLLILVMPYTFGFDDVGRRFGAGHATLVDTETCIETLRHRTNRVTGFGSDGVAVDTPDGLVVPVIRDCDRKSLIELANELIEASVKARDKKLSPADMSGGCISISSLGGIGGTAFTPIVNAPEVAILGVSRAQMKPVYKDGEFEPRLILPLSLSYDHRVIDGADGARFTSFLSKVLSDTRRLLL